MPNTTFRTPFAHEVLGAPLLPLAMPFAFRAISLFAQGRMKKMQPIVARIIAGFRSHNKQACPVFWSWKPDISGWAMC
jgi:hypothetical protein